MILIELFYLKVCLLAVSISFCGFIFMFEPDVRSSSASGVLVSQDPICNMRSISFHKKLCESEYLVDQSMGNSLEPVHDLS